MLFSIRSFMIVALQVVAYGIARPAREVLFTVVSRDEKYCAKVKSRLMHPCLYPGWEMQGKSGTSP